ncbi:endonuclease V [Ideonella sp. A 288]|uniref:endonuclease V n=1 Tax=Ideonella sp. A 288 TaxID=1962181 RepID=UPI000B4ABF8A|nr:endonuclease V [Ideonella sp. A 288]
MKLAVVVQRDGEGAVAAAVAFDEWNAPEPSRTVVARMAQVEKAARGALDVLVLPCLLQLLREHALAPEVIVLDGLVHLDAAETPAIGWHLHRALEGRVPVIGVSKASMPDLPAQFKVHREDDAPPLVVTCLGIDLGAAKARVRAMHGRRRVPTLLKRLARAVKDGAG